MGNVVGLPEAVIPVEFDPVTVGSPRQQATTVGIYALPDQDSKVREVNGTKCVAALINNVLHVLIWPFVVLF